ncbi:sulfatase-like hydrolase/transferase [Phytoactinopolyspora endophytica]|uniref:sulfatase-like hydrolase/transferase n=1 Tax=Phytoactinopolyspora endophytica TaxID=1642495 RepID=UPI00101B70F5
MPDAGTTRPNVIVVFTDQQRWDSTGVHGNTHDLTPNFDRMARSGTHAMQAFTPQPVCGPARAAIQTGQYPTATGCFRNGIPLPQGCRTLADYFGDAGYDTGYLGKWHLADTEPVPSDQRGGYRSWLGANVMEFTSDAYRVLAFDEDDVPVMLPGYRSDALFDAAIRFVADHAVPPGSGQHRSRPFYLFCSLVEPHHQNETDSYPAPVGYEERYRDASPPPDLATLAGDGSTVHRHIGGYYGQIRRVDEGLGRLFDALRSMDLLDNTIVAFTSDHGCHFKTRNSEYKRSCHDGSTRVPMALSGPGFDGGNQIDRPVSTIDLPPTLLAAAGLDVPAEMHGRSMLPLITDPGGSAAADWPEEVFIQISESQVGRAIRTSRWKYCVTAPDVDPWAAASSDHYLETELYDLQHDPYELDNLVGLPSHREIADELRGRMLRRMVVVGEKEPVIAQPAATVPAGQRRVDASVHSATWTPGRFGHQLHND